MKRVMTLWLTCALLAPWASGAQGPGVPPAGALQQALQDVEAGRVDEAIARLEGAVREDATDPRVPAMLGVLYIEQGRAEEALRLLAPLADRDDANPAALYNAGRAALALGEEDLAARYLQRSVDAVPNTPAARMLGLLHFENRRYLVSYLLLKPWVDRHPDDAEARRAAAGCALRLGRPDEAEALLTDIPAEDPETKILWGKLFLLRDDPFTALAMLRPLQDDPSAASVDGLSVVLADVYLALRQPKQALAVLEGEPGDDPQVAWRRSEAQYVDGDLQGALVSIEPLARRLLADTEGDFLDSQVLVQYGRLLTLSERYEEALPPLRRATELTPGSVLAWRTLGEALSGLDAESTEGRAALARAAELARATGGARRAEAGDERGPEPAADATARQLRRAQILLSEGRAAEAIALTRQEQRLNPGDIRPYLVEAQMHQLEDDYDQALDAVDRALEVAPGNVDASYFRGVVLMGMRDLAAAEAAFRALLEEHPDHVPTLSDLAVLLSASGRKDEARTLAQRVLRLRPGDAASQRLLDEIQGQ